MYVFNALKKKKKKRYRVTIQQITVWKLRLKRYWYVQGHIAYMQKPKCKPSFTEFRIQYLCSVFSSSQSYCLSPPIPTTLYQSFVDSWLSNYTGFSMRFRRWSMSEISPSMLLISSLAISLSSSFFMYITEMKLLHDSLFKYLSLQYVFLVITLIFYHFNIYFSFFICVSILLWLPMTKYPYRLISMHVTKMDILVVIFLMIYVVYHAMHII